MISLLSKSKMSQLRSIRLFYMYILYLFNHLRDSIVNEFKIELKLKMGGKGGLILEHGNFFNCVNAVIHKQLI